LFKKKTIETFSNSGAVVVVIVW